MLCVVSFTISSVSASFMYQEIDPICSISGTTHTSFPWEISDTSDWNMPKAYDGECLKYDVLSESEKQNISEIISWYFENKNYVDMKSSFANINNEGRSFVKNVYFPAIQSFIQNEVQKDSPNPRNLAIISYAAKVIGYDYTL